MAKSRPLYMSIDCPKCGTLAGFSCPGLLGGVHRERSAIAPMGKMTGSNIMKDRTKFANRANHCNEGRHFRCNGQRLRRFGMERPCFCPCHKKRKVLADLP